MPHPQYRMCVCVCACKSLLRLHLPNCKAKLSTSQPTVTLVVLEICNHTAASICPFNNTPYFQARKDTTFGQDNLTAEVSSKLLIMCVRHGIQNEKHDGLVGKYVKPYPWWCPSFLAYRYSL